MDPNTQAQLVPVPVEGAGSQFDPQKLFEWFITESPLKSQSALVSLAATAVTLHIEICRIQTLSRACMLSERESRSIPTLVASLRSTLEDLGLTERHLTPSRPQLSEFERTWDD